MRQTFLLTEQALRLICFDPLGDSEGNVQIELTVFVAEQTANASLPLSEIERQKLLLLMSLESSQHSLNAEIGGILFDMDGVLIDSEPLHEFTLLELSTRFGRRFESQADLEMFKGRTELTAAQNLLERFPHLTLTPAEIIKLRLDQVRENFHLVTIIKGVRVFLDRCKVAGYRIGLTTSADPSIQQLAFSTFQLSEFFDAVVTGLDVKASKPDPEPYLLTAAKLGVPPSRCLVIEDALSGVHSGKSAGCRVAALTTSFPREALLEAGADFVATSFEMLSASFFGTNPTID